jgi:hypothetical protein
MRVGGNMNTAAIIEQIDAEISKLQQAKVLLTDATAVSGKRAVGRPKTSKAVTRILSVTPAKHLKRVMSAEGKARIAEAQKARWAAKRKQEKKAAIDIAKVKAAKKAAKVAAVKSTPAKAENGA